MFSRRVFLRRAGFLGTAVAASACSGELPFVAENRPLSESLPENLSQGSAFEDPPTAPPEVQLDRNEAFAEAAERYEFLAARTNATSFLQGWRDSGEDFGDAWLVSNGPFSDSSGNLFLVIDLPSIVNCQIDRSLETQIFIGFDNYIETLQNLGLRQTGNPSRLMRVQVEGIGPTWLAEGSRDRSFEEIVSQVINAQTVDVDTRTNMALQCQPPQRLTR